MKRHFKWLSARNSQWGAKHLPNRSFRRRPSLESLENRRLLAADLLYIGDGGTDSIHVFDAGSGDYVSTLVHPAAAGLRGPRGMVIQGNDLLVVNQNLDTPLYGEVLRFDLDDPSQFSKLIAFSSIDAPFAPYGIVVKDNVAYVADARDDGISTAGRIAKYDATSGEFQGDIAPSGFDGEFRPLGLVIGPDDGLYVSVASKDLAGTADPAGYILWFDTTTNDFNIVAWNNGDGQQQLADGETIGLHNPQGLVFGPDGNLYVTSNRVNKDTFVDENTHILIIDPNSGTALKDIDLGANASSKNETRIFAQAMVFGPEGKLFIPIAEASLDDGSVLGGVRAYDPLADSMTSFITPSFFESYLVFPWYATFGNTDPGTLAYVPKVSGELPQSRVAELARYSGLQFDVHWDLESGHAGGVTFDILVSTDGRPYEEWLDNTTSRKGRFAGHHGVSYQFVSLARDAAGNVELLPATPDASTVARFRPWQNPLNRFDVQNRGLRPSASDALVIINYLGMAGPNRELPEPSADRQPGNGAHFWDVNGNGSVSALDALQVINELARLSLTDVGIGQEADVLKANPGQARGDLEQSSLLVVSTTGASSPWAKDWGPDPGDAFSGLATGLRKGARMIAAASVDAYFRNESPNTSDDNTMDASETESSPWDLTLTAGGKAQDVEA